ncbi:hypothetical protein [Streptomyces venezuelae]|uniref:hypothetical protein n=1 Tax=Streptomyces venezuelae TaxID=54571 RepID=UPI001CC2309F|nr:hypothetical protein [Streptomyces venezuelae]
MGSEHPDRRGDHEAAVRLPRQGLWEEEPGARPRMPDPVRAAAVRAVLIVAVALTLGTITFFLAVTGSWLSLPMVLISVAGTIVATWGVLDVWITRQMWKQRHGVVSVPSSTARGRRGTPEAGYGPPPYAPQQPGPPYAAQPYAPQPGPPYAPPYPGHHPYPPGSGPGPQQGSLRRA